VTTHATLTARWKIRSLIQIFFITAIGFGVGWVCGEEVPLGHMGVFPPLFAIPGAAAGLIVGIVVAIIRYRRGAAAR